MILQTYGRIKRTETHLDKPAFELETNYGQYNCLLIGNTNALILAGRPVMVSGLYYKDVIFCDTIKSMNLKTFGVLQQVPKNYKYFEKLM